MGEDLIKQGKRNVNVMIVKREIMQVNVHGLIQEVEAVPCCTEFSGLKSPENNPMMPCDGYKSLFIRNISSFNFSITIKSHMDDSKLRSPCKRNTSMAK